MADKRSPHYPSMPEADFRAELVATALYLGNKLAQQNLDSGLEQGKIARELFEWAAYLKSAIESAKHREAEAQP